MTFNDYCEFSCSQNYGLIFILFRFYNACKNEKFAFLNLEQINRWDDRERAIIIAPI